MNSSREKETCDMFAIIAIKKNKNLKQDWILKKQENKTNLKYLTIKTKQVF
jgi:hypothetical protein